VLVGVVSTTPALQLGTLSRHSQLPVTLNHKPLLRSS